MICCNRRRNEVASFGQVCHNKHTVKRRRNGIWTGKCGSLPDAVAFSIMLLGSVVFACHHQHCLCGKAFVSVQFTDVERSSSHV